MPLAPDGSILLYELTRGKLAQKLPSGWQSRYNRKNSKSIESRLKICLNLAAAVHYVHSLNAYTFVDLQPKNILVTEDGRVSLIDLDSMQIAPSGKVLFPARVTTPDYAPAEYIDFSKSYVPPSWDRFALAVVFYEILCGIHPYAGTFGGPHQHITNCTEAIKADLFVWGKHQGSVAVRPAPHDQFTALPDGLQRLFHRAFTSNASNRPKAEEWGQALFTSVSGQKSAAPVITKSAPQPQPVKTTQPTAAPPLKQAGDNFLTWLVLVLAILGALFLVVQKPATTSPTVVYTDKGAEK
jgi:serine/threonine protein kinase